MTLLDSTRTILNRLGPQGWEPLLARHGLNLRAADLGAELSRDLPGIDRTVPGFEDFAREGRRGIEPGNPARSLLYHALSSPNVARNADGSPLGAFPTLAELETVENLVYGLRPPSLADLQAQAQGAPLAIVVFAAEYRPAAETVQRRHADLCFTRTGVSRIGTAPARYEPALRGFLPFDAGNERAVRVLPARYSAWIAVQRTGNAAAFGPLRVQANDSTRRFWVPVHKLFSGAECLRGLDLQVTLAAHHVNEKLRRVHLEFARQGIDAGWAEPAISQSPFIFTEGIAELATQPEFGNGLLIPVVHPHLVEAAEFQGKPLTYRVPNNADALSSSLSIPAEDGFRQAPEYVHARHRVLQNGTEENLNSRANVAQAVRQGGYRARHYLDFTGDGWIEALVPELGVALPRRIPAYSLVTAPDFFPNCDQRELLEWTQQSVPQSLRNGLWRIPPDTLADTRVAPNLQLAEAGFRPEDQTATAIVSMPQPGVVQSTTLNVAPTRRNSYLTDAAAGVFAPGWDVSLSRTQTSDRTPHLAAYGLGSPFPEDAKLCAALSTFWPAVAPDATRTFEPNWNGSNWFTVAPLTDEEIGRTGNLPWDGIPGPRLVASGNTQLVEYSDMEHADYVESALKDLFSVSRTGRVDVREYEARVLAMARAYRVLLGNASATAKAAWSLLSFQKLDGSPDPELRQAQAQTGVTLAANPYRFQIYRHGRQSLPNANGKKRVAILEMAILYADPLNILVRRGTGPWQARRV